MGRSMFRLGVVGIASAGLVAGLLGYGPAPAAGQQRAIDATVVSVTAGKPSEFSFTLSKSSILGWAPSMIVTFKVTNRGTISHQFKVCTAPVAIAKLNTCAGKATSLLKPGQSATLTFTCTQRATYEYLSGVPGQAAKGMKGLIGMGWGFSAPKPATTTPATSKPTTPSTPATTTPPSNGLTGAAAAGAALFESGGCCSCHALAQVRAAGTVTPSLNATHSGGSFTSGPLSAQQLNDLAAYING